MTVCKGHPLAWLHESAAALALALMVGMPTSAIASSPAQATAITPETTIAPASMGGLVSQHHGNRCVQGLHQGINQILARPQFVNAQWGIAIEPLRDAVPLYIHHSDDLLIPASNIKLLTTAAALRIIAERSPQSLPNYWEAFDVINRHSDNYRADQLLRTIGGQLAVNRALEPLGISPNDYEQVDGSGLSRGNRAKPSTFVTLLKAMYQTDTGRIFYDSLPVSGVNGTLRNRFKGTSLQGKVHAKTGTLRGVRALSGYVETPDYGTVAFSIVVNQPGQSGRVMLQAIDEMVQQIALVRPCQSS